MRFTLGNKMKIPRIAAKWIIWLLGISLWGIHPLIMISYYEVTQRLGWYPPEADSIGIPIIGGFVVAVVGLPFFIMMCLRAVRRITDRLNVLEWDTERVWRSTIVTLLFGFFAFLSMQSIYFSFRLLQEIKESPFAEHQLPTFIRMALSVGWITFWLLIRSCFATPKQAEQSGTGQPATRSESDSEGGDNPQPESEARSR
jgi:hypothetical protein